MQETVGKKPRMVRKQVFITAEQNRRLKAMAAAIGVAEAELIRAGVELRLKEGEAEDDWRDGIDKISGAWAEREDMQEFVRELRKGSSRRLKRLGLYPSREK